MSPAYTACVQPHQALRDEHGPTSDPACGQVPISSSQGTDSVLPSWA